MTQLMTELLPGLPEEIALECLTRLHYSTYRVAAQVCRRWSHLLKSRDFYYHKKQTGRTHKAACLIQALPAQPQPGLDHTKHSGPTRYGVSIFDPVNGSWEPVDPVPGCPDGLPLFCQVASSEGKLVIMGGWDPVSYEPLRAVFVYQLTTRQWRRGKDMPDNRSFFAAGGLKGHVIIAGGHDENKNALNSAWVYHVRREEWSELSGMSQERDECEGVVIGSQFWVVSGYKTDSQGTFEGSAEVIEVGGDEWKRVEEAWEASECPRSRLGVSKSGELCRWDESGWEVKVGLCAVQSGGEWTFVSGAAYQGGPQGFFLVEGQNGKPKKLGVPGDFSGFVQSGCCVEV